MTERSDSWTFDRGLSDYEPPEVLGRLPEAGQDALDEDRDVRRAAEILARYFPSPADARPRALAAAAIVGELRRSSSR